MCTRHPRTHTHTRIKNVLVLLLVFLVFHSHSKNRNIDGQNEKRENKYIAFYFTLACHFLSLFCISFYLCTSVILITANIILLSVLFSYVLNEIPSIEFFLCRYYCLWHLSEIISYKDILMPKEILYPFPFYIYSFHPFTVKLLFLSVECIRRS